MDVSKLSTRTEVQSIYSIEDFIVHFEKGGWKDGEVWGSRVLLMEKEGLATGRVSYYYDEPEVLYLDGLSVDSLVRRKGLGTKVLELQEQVGRVLGIRYACMCVERESWLYGWYVRKGYIDYEPDEEGAYMWVRKELIKKTDG